MKRVTGVILLLLTSKIFSISPYDIQKDCEPNDILNLVIYLRDADEDTREVFKEIVTKLPVDKNAEKLGFLHMYIDSLASSKKVSEKTNMYFAEITSIVSLKLLVSIPADENKIFIRSQNRKTGGQLEHLLSRYHNPKIQELIQKLIYNNSLPDHLQEQPKKRRKV